MMLSLEILPSGDAIAEWADPATGDVTTETIEGYALAWTFPAPPSEERPMFDATFTNSLGFASLTGLTPAGRDWITANVPVESWQKQGPTIYLEGAYLSHIVWGMVDEGLEVEGAESILGELDREECHCGRITILNDDGLCIRCDPEFCGQPME